MDEHTKAQEGSPSRDRFKRLHKDLPRVFYASDLDFLLLEKEPFPDIVAVLDYKAAGDAITFAETIAYNAMLRRGIPVFIVKGDAERGTFRIGEFVGGHHGKPRYEIRVVTETKSWKEFGEWERSLRQQYKHKFRA